VNTHKNLARRGRMLAPMVALVLFLAQAGVAAAADQTSTTAQTLTVVATTTLTGVPATVSYGSGLSGMLSGPTYSTSVVAGSNSGTGVKLTVAFTNLTATGGSIPSTANFLQASDDPAALDCPGGAGATSGWNGGKPYPGPTGTDWILCTRPNPGSLSFPGSSLTWKLMVNLPLNQAAGSYTGTVTWKATEL
jgi:hypothetical protein